MNMNNSFGARIVLVSFLPTALALSAPSPSQLRISTGGAVLQSLIVFYASHTAPSSYTPRIALLVYVTRYDRRRLCGVVFWFCHEAPSHGPRGLRDPQRSSLSLRRVRR